MGLSGMFPFAGSLACASAESGPVLPPAAPRATAPAVTPKAWRKSRRFTSCAMVHPPYPLVLNTTVLGRPRAFLLSLSYGMTRRRPGQILQTTGHQGRPARLVTCPQAAPSLAMEVFVEQHQVAPVRVGGKTPIVAMAGAAAMLVREKE